MKDAGPAPHWPTFHTRRACELACEPQRLVTDMCFIAAPPAGEASRGREARRGLVLTRIVIVSRPTKKTRIVSSRDWFVVVVVVVEAGVVRFRRPPPPRSVAVPVAKAPQRRPRNVRVCWRLSLVAAEGHGRGRRRQSHRDGGAVTMRSPALYLEPRRRSRRTPAVLRDSPLDLEERSQGIHVRLQQRIGHRCFHRITVSKWYKLPFQMFPIFFSKTKQLPDIVSSSFTRCASFTLASPAARAH